MLAATCFGIFIIPTLYVVIQTLRARAGGKNAETPPAAQPSEGPA